MTIKEELAQIMSPKNIELWLNTPNLNLKGQTPKEILDKGRKDIILSMIERAKQGTFS